MGRHYEDFEIESITNLAFKDGYAKGRADQKAEDNEFFNFEGAWQLEKQKIRVDAIDDCKTILKTQHMIRTTEDDFCAKVEIPFYTKLWNEFGRLKEKK